jgi:hypothetical protein
MFNSIKLDDWVLDIYLYNQKPTHHLFYFSNFQNSIFPTFVSFKIKNNIFIKK